MTTDHLESPQAFLPIMAKPIKRIAPWDRIPCAPSSLLDFVSATIRDDHERLHARLIEARDTAQCIDILSRRHRLGPFLFFKLHEKGLWDALPIESRQRLGESMKAQESIAIKSLETLNHLRVLLAARGIPFVVLKGLEIATRFYGTTVARGYRDIDLLISERDRNHLMDCLQSSGWHRLSRIFLSAQITGRYQHAFDYRKGDALLDVHWSLSRLPGIAIDTEEVMNRSRFEQLGDSSYQVLGIVDELILLLISAFADIQRGALRLQSFVDIAMVSSRFSPSDWEQLHDQARRFKALVICQEVIRMINSLLGLSLWSSHMPTASRIQNSSEDLLLLLPSLGAWRSKIWAMKHLPVSPFHYSAWWMMSLPARTLASHPRFRRRAPRSKSVS